MIQYICIAVLAVMVIYLLIRLLMVKGNIRELRVELKRTREEDYNRQVRVSLVDSDIEKLASEINKNLEYQQTLKRETELSRKQLEQSISDIAHDLRTPLTVIKGNLQMLEKEELSDKGCEYLSISRRKSETLKGMVDEFFELSVLESDSKPVELSKLDIIGFLSEFVIENETLIREKNLVPEIIFPEKSVFIQANRELLTRVFSNLMGNILKYAKGDFMLEVDEETVNESGRRAVGSFAVDNDRKICSIRIGNHVSDPEAIDIDHIFERTYRADKARSDGSAGLGLYIAKILVEKQKGSISAELEGDRLLFYLRFES